MNDEQGAPDEAMIVAGAAVLMQATGHDVAGCRHWAIETWKAMKAAEPILHDNLAQPLTDELKRIADRLEEAAETYRLWCAGRGGPVTRMAWWPDVIHNTFEAHNAAQPRGAGTITLYAPEIDRMWEAQSWLHWLDKPLTRKIVWSRAQRLTWRSLEARYGLTAPTLRKRWIEGLALIAAKSGVVSPAPQVRKIAS